MKPTTFPGASSIFGEDQPEYLPLPAERVGDPEYGEILTCWQLSFGERLRVLLIGRIWHRQLKFNQPLQPVKMSTERG